MKKDNKRKCGIVLGYSQTVALNKIITLINRADLGWARWSYGLEKDDDIASANFVVRIRNYVTEETYAEIQYVNGEMFKLTCSDMTMLLTGDEVLDYLKKLDLVK